ncbi:MAG: hypothetical protein JNM06_14165 [Blastocatellia bacterium]|nr:hypothetical protein [Blastocatellia bacterium]
MESKNKKNYTWTEVKQLCQLSEELIKKAKALKLSPNSLANSWEISKQPGKLPVSNWINNLYEKQEKLLIKSKQTIDSANKLNKSDKSINKVDKVDKVVKFPGNNKKPTAVKQNLAEENLAKIYKLALTIEDESDDLPLELWDLVQWMVENKKESLVREIMNNEDLSETAFDSLDFILKDVGYRYPAVLPVMGSKGKAKMEEFELIPFAISFLVPIPEEKLSKVPATIPKVVNKLLEEKIIRKALGLNDKPFILLDPHLYHVDHEEWLQESAVMEYLQGYLAYFSQSTTNLSPLTKNYKKPSVISQTEISDDVPQYCLLMRVLCGVVLASEEDAIELEEELFDFEEMELTEKALKTREKAWEKVEKALVKEFEHNGIELPSGIFVNPSAIELWDIPRLGSSLGRILPLQIDLHNAIAQLLTETNGEELFTPQIFLSLHGEDESVEEVRLALYSDTNKPAFFHYLWTINPDLDDPEDISTAIVAIASEIEAEVTVLEGILPKTYCSDCGEPLFYGPGEDSVAVIHNHKEYIN